MSPHGDGTEVSMMDRFAEDGFETVEVEGESVHSMYWATPLEGDVVRIEWLGAASPRPQRLIAGPQNDVDFSLRDLGRRA
jgi:hypothetical protein